MFRLLTMTIAFLLVSPARSPAQEINLKEVFKAPQYAPVLALLDIWNGQKVEFVKTNFKDDFEKDIKAIAERNKKPEAWVKQRVATWASLKPTLVPRKKLSVNAQILLLAAYSENATAFIETVKDPKDREYRLSMKLYLVLSIAQDQATTAESPEILPSHVLGGLQRAWTGLWPFCPEKTP